MVFGELEKGKTELEKGDIKSSGGDDWPLMVEAPQERMQTPDRGALRKGWRHWCWGCLSSAVIAGGMTPKLSAIGLVPADLSCVPGCRVNPWREAQSLPRLQDQAHI